MEQHKRGELETCAYCCCSWSVEFMDNIVVINGETVRICNDCMDELAKLISRKVEPTIREAIDVYLKYLIHTTDTISFIEAVKSVEGGNGRSCGLCPHDTYGDPCNVRLECHTIISGHLNKKMSEADYTHGLGLAAIKHMEKLRNE